MSLEPLDQANVQESVDFFATKPQRWQRERKTLHKAILEFKEFMHQPTPKDATEPIQLRWDKQTKFTQLTLPITEATWVCDISLFKLKEELWQSEMGAQTITTMGLQAIEDNKKLDALRSFRKKSIRDTRSPYYSSEPEFEEFREIKHQWKNMKHIWELASMKRLHHNTKTALELVTMDMMAVYTAYVEGGLVPLFRLTMEIMLADTQKDVKEILTAYTALQERHSQMEPYQPMSQQFTQPERQ